MNKVLCTVEANRRKGARAPAEAWSGDKLREIMERAERLFKKKAWRFQLGAMDRFKDQGGPIARLLTDTQYISRLATTYLEHICPKVRASNGQLTGMLRGKWGLNRLLPDDSHTNTNQPKNRKDHRHHLIDAFVLAYTDIALLQRIATASGRAEAMNLDRLFPKGEFPTPYEGYREDLDRLLKKTIVSHRPDHGLSPGAQRNAHVTSGTLHEETAYGLVDEEIDGKRYNLVYRKPIHKLSSSEIKCVRDNLLRRDLQALAATAGTDKELKESLAAFGQKHGVRRVRVLKTEQLVYEVRHGDGNRFVKAYSPGDNHRIEIYELPNGQWQGEGVTVYDANQPDFKPAWRQAHPGAKLVMRVHKGDLIEADFGDGRGIYRVCRLEASANQLRLAPHSEAGALQDRHADTDDPFRYQMKAWSKLKAAGARRVRVDPIGRRSVVQEKS